MYPCIKHTALKISNHRTVLLGECCCEVPSNHHFDVIILVSNLRNLLWKAFFKVPVQKVDHQYFYPVSDRVDLFPLHPFLCLCEEAIDILGKAFRAHGVAGRPIIYIRKELIDPLNTFFEIGDLLDQECVQVVLLIILVWKIIQKLHGIGIVFDLPCKCA